jgi:molecular chaperone DnaK
VSAQDKATGKSQKITITASTNLSESDIDRMVRDAEQHAAEDQQRREVVEARNTADQVVYQTEQSLANLNGQVSAENRSEIEAKINELRAAMNGNDLNRIQSLTDEVQQAAMAIGQAAYGQPNSPDGANANGYQASGGHSNGKATANDDEDIVEGEFEAA